MRKKKHQKYHFNFMSLEFEVVKTSLKAKLLKLMSLLATATVFSAVVIFLAYSFFNSPKEKMLKREIQQYELQYKIMNDKLERINTVLNDLRDRDDNIYRVIFEAEPIPDEVREAGFGGVNRYEKYNGFKNSEILADVAKKIDIITSKLYIQSKSFDEVYEMAKNKNAMLAAIPAIQPIENKNLTRIAAGFGYRFHPILKRQQFHSGIDFTAPKGTPIYATGAGTVEEVGYVAGGYGKIIVINHGYGYKSLYGHLSTTNVTAGQKITRGQIIGRVGNTGLSSGPHLHYEVMKNGEKVNPVYFFYNDLTPEEYEKVLELAAKNNQALS